MKFENQIFNAYKLYNIDNWPSLLVERESDVLWLLTYFLCLFAIFEKKNCPFLFVILKNQ